MDASLLTPGHHKKFGSVVGNGIKCHYCAMASKGNAKRHSARYRRYRTGAAL